MSQLPVKKDENFYAPAEKMDFSPLKEKIFVVAASSGDRNGGKALTTTIHGPYDFCEMVEAVGSMWKDCLLHAKPFILSKNPQDRVKWLDKNTVDYIEEKWEDIIAESFFENVLSDSQKYTCQAGVEEATAEEPAQKEE